MVTRLFASKSSSGGSGHTHKKSLPQETPPPPPPASHKPKSPFSPMVGKPPRRRPTNLPLSQSSPSNTSKLSPTQPYQQTNSSPPQPHQQYSSKTPPASTFRSGHHPLYVQRHNPGHGVPLNRHIQPSQDNRSDSGIESTYTSFADTGPTYSYLDLTRARSDESLLWTAEEEASALVAELRASINCNNTNSDNSINCVGRNSGVYSVDETKHRGLNPYQFRKDYYNGSVEKANHSESTCRTENPPIVDNDPAKDIATISTKHIRMSVPQHNPFQRSFSVNKGSFEARQAAQKLNQVQPLRSHSFTDLQSAVELVPLRQQSTESSSRPGPMGGSSLGGSCGLSSSTNISGYIEQSDSYYNRGCGLPLKTFGGSWKSLLRVGAMSGRSSVGKPPGGVVGVKKVAPPTVPGHHQHVPLYTTDTPSTSNTGAPPAHLAHPLPGGGGSSPQGSNNPTTTPDTPTSSTSSSGSGPNSNYRHSGSSFHSSSTASSGVFSGTDQRSSFSSSICSSEDAVSTNSSNPPPSPCSPSSGTSSIDGRGGVGRPSGPHVVSPSHYTAQGGQFTFPPPTPQFAHLLCKSQSPQHGHSPHHHQQQHGQHQGHGTPEDQGIDVQSPVRSSSPGSGSGSSSTGSTASTSCCRNSTTSLDSGRASTSTHHPHHQHRLSGQSYDSGSGTGSLRHSYHSSSSSIGSIESPHLNVNDLLNNGVRDCEVLRAWLTELHMEEHTDKFLSAGYDMPTISRTTPEDLNAIGITKPSHRKKLKAEISRLNISDGLPDHIPSTLEEWVSLLRLSEYSASLQRQGYRTPLQMLQVMWEDLEEMGITKLGHQKKVMLAIKRIRDIKGGKKFSSSLPPQPEVVAITRDCPPVGEAFPAPGGDYRTFQRAEGYSQRGAAGDMYATSYSGALQAGYNANGAQFSPSVYRSFAGHHGVAPPPPGSPLHRHNSQLGGHSGSSNSGNGSQHSSYVGQGSQSSNLHPAVQYRPDFVTVQVHPQVRRNKDGVFEEPIYSTFHPDNNRFSQYHQQQQQQQPQQQQYPQHQSNQFSSLPPRPTLPAMLNSYPPRSLDDGDITPTNEMTSYEGGGGTLPRHRTSNNKFRPVAKVSAKTRVDVHHEMSHHDNNSSKPCSTVDEENEKTLLDGPNGCIKQKINVTNANKIENIYNIINSHSTNNTPQGTPKKQPPPPPRRSNSISETSKLDSLNSINASNTPSTLPSNTPNNSVQNREGHYGFLRRGMNYGYMGVKNNLQPDIASDLPPPPPAPNDVGNHQHILHHHSHRRQQMLPPQEVNEETTTADEVQKCTNKSANEPDTHGTQSQLGKPDVFPTPPASVALAAGTAEAGTTPAPTAAAASAASAAAAAAATAAAAAAAAAVAVAAAVAAAAGGGGPEEPGNIRPRRNDSTVSNCSHKSTSSTDSSDSIPFANDNAGTIKQRYTAPTTPVHHLHHSPHQSPSQLRRTTPHRASFHKPGLCTTPVRAATDSADGGHDVLSDIGNMLANLTDELDAMLEQEMAA